jgi:hypothetical protein
LTRFLKVYVRRFLRVLVLAAVIISSAWLILRAELNTEEPVVPVRNAGTCTAQPQCSGFWDVFQPTLHVDDLVLVQGVKATAVSAAYPDGDVLVFHADEQNLQGSELVITRVFEKEEQNGTTYFRTKADGEGTHKWPEKPDLFECDQWYGGQGNHVLNGMVSEKLLVGRVVFRIPWVGHLAILVGGSAVLVVIALVVLWLIVEFAVSRAGKEKAEARPQQDAEKSSKT